MRHSRSQAATRVCPFPQKLPDSRFQTDATGATVRAVTTNAGQALQKALRGIERANALRDSALFHGGRGARRAARLPVARQE
jgi:hypothetical protein